MNIKIKIAMRDKFCNYCNVSEYTKDWDYRNIYELRSIDTQNIFVVKICQECIEDLAYLIATKT